MISHLFTTLAQAAPAAPAGNSTYFFLQLIALGVVFYFLLIRPQQKQAKEKALLISAVKAGDKVVMNSGLHGIVSHVKETTILLKVADNVKLEFDKAAIAAVLKASSES
ncbi:MAG: preprotein translocase subunit YajC [Verrucomicrobiota bacterium]